MLRITFINHHANTVGNKELFIFTQGPLLPRLPILHIDLTLASGSYTEVVKMSVDRYAKAATTA